MFHLNTVQYTEFNCLLKLTQTDGIVILQQYVIIWANLKGCSTFSEGCYDFFNTLIECYIISGGTDSIKK